MITMNNDILVQSHYHKRTGLYCISEDKVTTRDIFRFTLRTLSYSERSRLEKRGRSIIPHISCSKFVALINRYYWWY